MGFFHKLNENFGHLNILGFVFSGPSRDPLLLVLIEDLAISLPLPRLSNVPESITKENSIIPRFPLHCNFWILSDGIADDSLSDETPTSTCDQMILLSNHWHTDVVLGN
ncbi:hypothetical protein YC2023_030002 [Brassica napus]